MAVLCWFTRVQAVSPHLPRCWSAIPRVGHFLCMGAGQGRRLPSRCPSQSVPPKQRPTEEEGTMASQKSPAHKTPGTTKVPLPR